MDLIKEKLTAAQVLYPNMDDGDAGDGLTNLAAPLPPPPRPSSWDGPGEPSAGDILYPYQGTPWVGMDVPDQYLPPPGATRPDTRNDPQKPTAASILYPSHDTSRKPEAVRPSPIPVANEETGSQVPPNRPVSAAQPPAPVPPPPSPEREAFDRPETAGPGMKAGVENKKPPSSRPMLEKSLDVTERVYRDYVTAARKRGWHLAGDFLERYLNGAGGKVTMSREQALGFKPIADADKRIKGYFERAFLESGFSENKKFKAAMRSLKDGGPPVKLADNWDGELGTKTLLLKG